MTDLKKSITCRAARRLRRRFPLIVWVALSSLTSGVARAQQFLPLWQKDHTPDTRWPVNDSIVNHRYYQVGTPGMYVFHPAEEQNTGAAVLICPGGGYAHITYQSGGFTLAKWFNVMGMTAFVLIYRLPNAPNLTDRAVAPGQDAQRAMRLIRMHADEWHIDTGKIGVMGASAGGHVAAFLGTSARDVSSVGDSADQYAFQPDFMILVSPVITMGAYAHKGSRKSLLGDNPSEKTKQAFSCELHVTSQTPPCFIADAFNDPTVDPHNSLLFYQALLNHHVPASFHVFPQGGHSIAMRNNPGSTRYWNLLCESWLREMHFLGTPVK